MHLLTAKLKFKRLHETTLIPTRGSVESVGYDIHAHLLTDTGRPNNCLLPPRMTRAIPTKLSIEAPPGYFVAVCSRSGMAQRSIFVTNSPGIIDPDYRGEIFVLLHNGGYESQHVLHGDRVAQLIVFPITSTELVEEELSSTERGLKGLGSTGR